MYLRHSDTTAIRVKMAAFSQIWLSEWCHLYVVQYYV